MVLFPLLALTLFGALVVAVVRAFRGNPPRQSKQDREQETGLIQEIYHGLSRTEKRIEVLETILLDDEGMERNERGV
jgi:hypothetical protein